MSESFERNPKQSNIIQAEVIQAEVVPGSYTNVNNDTDAIPNQYFKYDNVEAINNEYDRQYFNPNSIPIAPAFVDAENESPAEQARAVASKARFGSDMGRIQAIEEKERIKRVSANAKGLAYFESKRVAAGGEVAKQRAREGLEVKTDKYFDESNLLAARKARDMAEAETVAKSRKSSGGQGYQVPDYNTAEYDCKGYETTEYKSVYD